jgi:predicted nuclease with TOPRIM domain
MSFENYPTGITPEGKPVATKPPKKDYRNTIIIVLIIVILGVFGYHVWDKNKSQQENQNLTTQLINTDSSKNELQRELNDATMQIDMLKSSNSKADSVIRTKEKDIQDLRQKVQEILNNKNSTASQLADARRLVATLRSNIASYTEEINRLQTENQKLTEEKKVVTEERDVVKKNFDSARDVIRQKEEVIDVASTLHASNFDIEGINEKRSGKEKETTKAKKVDKLRITFDVDANRVTASGSKDIYISITDPSGQPVAVEALGSGKFVTRDGIERYYTKKVQINYSQGQNQKVTVEWRQDSEFKTGDYKIEVYNNGFKIGEGTRSFKKGGLFG